MNLLGIPADVGTQDQMQHAVEQTNALEQTYRAVSMIMMHGLQSLVEGSNTLPPDTSLDALRKRQYTQSAEHEAIHLHIVEQSLSLLPVEPFLSNVKQDPQRLSGVSRYTLRDRLARKHDLQGSRVEQEQAYELYPLSVAKFAYVEGDIGALRFVFSNIPQDVGMRPDSGNPRLAIAGVMLWLAYHDRLDTMLHNLSTAWNAISDTVDSCHTLSFVQRAVRMHCMSAYHDVTLEASATETPWEWQEPLQIDTVVEHIGNVDRMRTMVNALERVRYLMRSGRW